MVKAKRMTIKTITVAIAALCLVSCSKSSSSSSSLFDTSLPLKSVPHATINNHTIELDVTKCQGPIVRFEWSRYDTATVTYPITFTTVTSWKTSDSQNPLIVQAQVTKPGDYAFQLIVYDKNNNQNSQFFTVIVSQ